MRMVSRSRISETTMTSGSWRSAWRRARGKLRVSPPISRCLIRQELCWKMNSMGSSRVMITPLRVSAMRLTIEARVVDLPGAGDAGDEDEAAAQIAELVDDRVVAEGFQARGCPG